MNATFWIVYVVFGVIAQIIAIKDMRRCIANRMVGNPDITFHAENQTTGERIDVEATRVHSDDDIVKNAIDQKANDEFERNWKEHPWSMAFGGLAGLCLWPIVIPLLMLFAHKCTDAFVDDIVETKQEA